MKASQLVKWKSRDEKTIARNVKAYMEILQVDENGKVKTTETFKLDAYLNILSHHIEIHKVPSSDVKRNLLFRAGFLRLKKYKNQDINNFRRALAAEVRNYLQKSLKTYYVLFPLHGVVQEESSYKSYSILGKSLLVDTWENVCKNFQTDKFFQESKYRRKDIDLQSCFTPILIQSEGRDLNEVFDHAEEYFDLFRCLLNLLYAFGFHQRQWGYSKPLAQVLSPPVFGIFATDGKYETYYYNLVNHSDYKRNPITRDHFEDTQGLADRLGTTHDEKIIEDLLVEALKKYGRALDTDEWRLAFLELWQILELLTLQSNEQLNMKQVLSRVNCLLNQEQFIKDLLMMLYGTRNKLVHEGHFSARKGLEKVSLLKYVVERTINAFFGLLEDIPDKNGLVKYYNYLPLGDSELNARNQVISIIQAQRKNHG